MEIRTHRNRMTRLIPAVALLSVSVLAFAACSGGSFSASNDTESGDADRALKIGLIAPLTGAASLEGTSMQQGFELGLEAVNAQGGVLGHDVELVVADDMSEAATSTQAAQRLVREEHVDYLFGTIAGDTTNAVASVATEAEVPFSSAIMGIVPSCSPHFWPFGVTEPMVLEEIVPRMVEEYGPRVAFAGNDYLFPREYADVARTALDEAGAEFVVEEYSPLGTSEWQPVIAKMQQADPDWILTGVVGGDAVAFTQQAEQFGLLEGRGFTGTTHQQEFYGAISSAVEGRTTVLPYTDQLGDAANEEFVTEYRDAYDFDGPIPAVAATSYMAAQFIASAVEAADAYDADSISEQMAQTESEGVLGGGSFDPETHMWAQNMYVVKIQPDGEYELVEDLGVVSDPQPRTCA